MSPPPPKTQAMRALDAIGIPYDVVVFPDTIHDARGVADYTGLAYREVFKTLVVRPAGPGSRPALFLIPADRALDLKKAAQAIRAKSLEMASQVEAEKWTGLKVGGISALALLSRAFSVYLDRSAASLEKMVGAGQRGLNLRLQVEDFRRVTKAEWLDVSRPEAAT